VGVRKHVERRRVVDSTADGGDTARPLLEPWLYARGEKAPDSAAGRVWARSRPIEPKLIPL
jgi:hypothetical protein